MLKKFLPVHYDAVKNNMLEQLKCLGIIESGRYKTLTNELVMCEKNLYKTERRLHEVLINLKFIEHKKSLLLKKNTDLKVKFRESQTNLEQLQTVINQKDESIKKAQSDIEKLNLETEELQKKLLESKEAQQCRDRQLTALHLKVEAQNDVFQKIRELAKFQIK